MQMEPVVFMLLPYLELGGTERHAALLSESIKDEYEPVIIAPEGPGGEFFLGLEHLYFTRLDKNVFHGLRELKKVLSDVGNTKNCLIHVHASPELLIISKLINQSVPHVFTIHGFHGQGRNVSYFLAAYAAKFCARHTFCVSMNEYDKLIRMGMRKSQLSVAYNGIPDFDEQQTLRCTNNFEPIIGCVARLEPVKGLEYLIEGARILVNQGERFKLIIVGGGSDEDRLKQLAKTLKVDVKFTGQVTNVNDYYREFDIFVLPSLLEPQGIAPIEAMRARLPVIATRVGGLPEVVLDGETGLLVPPANPEALADAMRILLRDRDLRVRYGIAGRERFLRNFSVGRMKREITCIYHEIMEKTRH